MKKNKKRYLIIAVVIVILAVLLIGILSSRETKWVTFTDNNFSISYPQMRSLGSSAEPNILAVGNLSCNIMINKLPNQTNVIGAANFFKAELDKSSLITVLGQKIGSTEANFELRAIYNKKLYNSKMKVVTCNGNIYQILASCTENSYPKQAENISKTLDSIKCSN